MKALEILKVLYEYKNLRVLQGSDKKDYILKEIDEAISELEALQQPKSCEGCVRESEDMVDPHCAFCSRACKDNYEEKVKR